MSVNARHALRGTISGKETKSMNAPLSTAQRAELLGSLKLRQSQLAQRLAEHHEGRSRVEHARDVLLQDGDDAPQRDADREVDLVLSDIESRELAAVSAAIERSGHDSFGHCGDCGEPIAFKRLQLEPWALRCVACESRREQRGAGVHPATL
jgi:DnaK suppressor protein